jgi:hypothetical protein
MEGKAVITMNTTIGTWCTLFVHCERENLWSDGVTNMTAIRTPRHKGPSGTISSQHPVGP